MCTPDKILAMHVAYFSAANLQQRKDNFAPASNLQVRLLTFKQSLKTYFFAQH